MSCVRTWTGGANGSKLLAKDVEYFSCQRNASRAKDYHRLSVEIACNELVGGWETVWDAVKEAKRAGRSHRTRIVGTIEIIELGMLRHGQPGQSLGRVELELCRVFEGGHNGAVT